MDLEMDKNGFSFSNRANSCFTNFFKEENLKSIQKEPNNTNNIFSSNLTNATKNINENNYQIPPNKEVYPSVYKENNDNFNNMSYNIYYYNNINSSENPNQSSKIGRAHV